MISILKLGRALLVPASRRYPINIAQHLRSFDKVFPKYLRPIDLCRNFSITTTMSTFTAPVVSDSEWHKSPAEFDFRSDTVTTPTISQMAALQAASLGDDVYQESTTTNEFEKRMAQIFGKQDAVFVMSGTMGNQLSLRAILTQPPHQVLCDHRAHVITSEAGGLAMLSQAMTQPVVPSNGNYLTLEDIKKATVISDDVQSCPTRVISLENTLGGNIMPLEEVRKIGEWARKEGIKMHLDGARIWNVVSVYETVDEQLEKLKAYANEFDTVTACFSKGIGAPVGSIIVSTEGIISRVRHFRKAIGGGLRQVGILTAMANTAVEEVFLGGQLRRTHEQARKIADFWVNECRGRLGHEVETNIVWLDLNHAQVGGQEFEEEAQKAGVKVFGWGRIVVHCQISDTAVQRLTKLLSDLKAKADARIEAGEQFQGIKSGYGRW